MILLDRVTVVSYLFLSFFPVLLKVPSTTAGVPAS